MHWLSWFELLRGRQEPGEGPQSPRAVEVDSSRSEVADFCLWERSGRWHVNTLGTSVWCLGFGTKVFVTGQIASGLEGFFYSRTLCGRLKRRCIMHSFLSSSASTTPFVGFFERVWAVADRSTRTVLAGYRHNARDIRFRDKG